MAKSRVKLAAAILFGLAMSVPALAAGSPAPAPSPQAAGKSLLGEWSAQYLCHRRGTDAELVVRAGDGNSYSGILRIPASRQRGTLLAEDVELTITVDPLLNSVSIKPTGQGRPGRIETSAVNGLLSADGDHISGQVQGSECQSVEFVRTTAATPSPAATASDQASAAGTLLGATVLQDACKAVAAWIDRLDAEYSGMLQPGHYRRPLMTQMANLVREPYFSRFIGEPLAQFDKPTSAKAVKIIQQCYREKLLSPTEATAATEVLMVSQHPNSDLPAALQSVQMAEEWNQRARTAVANVPATQTGIETLKQLDQAVDANLAVLWPSEQQDLHSVINDRENAIVGTAMAAITGPNPNGPLTVEQIVKLDQLADSLAAGSQESANVARVKARSDSALAALMEQRVADAARFPATPQGLQDFKTWLAALHKEFAPVAGRPSVETGFGRIDDAGINLEARVLVASEPSAVPSLTRVRALLAFLKASPAVADQVRAAITHELSELVEQRMATPPLPSDPKAALADFAAWRARFASDYADFETYAPVKQALETIDAKQAQLQLSADLQDLRTKGEPPPSFEKLAAVTRATSDPRPALAAEATQIRTRLLATLIAQEMTSAPPATNTLDGLAAFMSWANGVHTKFHDYAADDAVRSSLADIDHRTESMADAIAAKFGNGQTGGTLAGFASLRDSLVKIGTSAPDAFRPLMPKLWNAYLHALDAWMRQQIAANAPTEQSPAPTDADKSSVFFSDRITEPTIVRAIYTGQFAPILESNGAPYYLQKLAEDVATVCPISVPVSLLKAIDNANGQGPVATDDEMVQRGFQVLKDFATMMAHPAETDRRVRAAAEYEYNARTDAITILASNQCGSDRLGAFFKNAETFFRAPATGVPASKLPIGMACRGALANRFHGDAYCSCVTPILESQLSRTQQQYAALNGGSNFLTLFQLLPASVTNQMTKCNQ